MSKKELCKRYLLFIVSLFFSGLGVAIARHGALGVPPISSVANVLSYRFSFLKPHLRKTAEWETLRGKAGADVLQQCRLRVQR